MKLYEVNQEIERLFSQAVDPETGEVLEDSDGLFAQISALDMERMEILQYMAKLRLNSLAEAAAINAEEDRLRARRSVLERKADKILSVLERECGGEKTDLGVATVNYRKTERVEVNDAAATLFWLRENGKTDCYRTPAPELNKTEVKRLLKAGTEIPGVTLEHGVSCTMK